VPIAILGGQNVILSHVVPEPGRAEAIGARYHAAATIAVAVGGALALAALVVGGPVPALWVLGATVWGGLIAVCEIRAALAQARRRPARIALWVPMPQAARTVVALVLTALAAAGLAEAGPITALTLLLAAALPLAVLLARGIASGAGDDGPPLRRLAAEGAPFALSGLLFLGHARLGLVVLGALAGAAAAGNLAVLQIAATAMLLLPTVLNQRLGLTRWHERGEKGRALLLRQTAWTTLGAAVIAGIWLLVQGPALELLYGDRYDEARSLAPWVAAVVLGRSLSLPMASATTRAGLRWQRTAAIAAGLTVNVVLLVALAPAVGVGGALAAWIAGDLTIAFGLALTLLRYRPA
jgi:O-antigen/teichoic acid export membrane protein